MVLIRELKVPEFSDVAKVVVNLILKKKRNICELPKLHHDHDRYLYSASIFDWSSYFLFLFWVTVSIFNVLFACAIFFFWGGEGGGLNDKKYEEGGNVGSGRGRAKERSKIRLNLKPR